MSLKRKKRVLAIDDEPAMTEWLKILLEHAGFERLVSREREELVREGRGALARPPRRPLWRR